MSEEETYEEWWNELIKGMEQFFGPVDDTALPATIPFSAGQDMGGDPDIVKFSQYADGILYVTADLTASKQKPNSSGNYELAVLHEGDEQWGVDIISQLAYHTLDNPIEDGDTMDIGLDTPENSSIEGLLFRRIAEFDVLGHTCGVLCCVGITESELQFCHEKDSFQLIEKLGLDFLTTNLYRESRV